MGYEEDISQLSPTAIALAIKSTKILEALADPAKSGRNDAVFGGMAALAHHNAQRMRVPKNHACLTFGSSKGLGFDRILIIPPQKHIKFIGGDVDVFKADKTEESRNKLYVAITRARYSLAFVVEDKFAGHFAYPIWQSQPRAPAQA